MALILTAAPLVEPLTLDDAKHHLRVDHDADDAFITSLVKTSRLHVEAALGLALLTQSWRYQRDDWPADGIVLPLRPVQAITAISLIDIDDTAHTLDAGDYLLDGAGSPPMIHAKSPVPPRPGRTHLGVDIQFTAGFGDEPDAVPQPIRQAMSLLVAHWYEHREAVATGERGARIPLGVTDLLAPYRLLRI